MRLRKNTSALRRTAGEVKRYRREKRIVPIVMACLGLVTVIMYVISLLYTRFGSFTIGVNRFHQLQYGLSLCETPDFAKATSKLNCRASQVIDNIDGSELDQVDLGAVDGVDNGDNYMCYTFYCKNTGGETLDYEYSINIVNMTDGIEKAVRIRKITSLNNGKRDSVDYARASGVDSVTGATIPEPNTTPFYQKTIVCYDIVPNFQPEDVYKYTIVLWLEGNDPECVDNIMGGEFKIDMKFKVVSHAGIEV